MIGLALLLAAVGPAPGPLKTFRDWTVGCDNGGACQAVALAPEDAEEDYVPLVVTRDAGPDAAPGISFSVTDDRAGSVTVDGRRIAVAADGTVADADVPVLLKAMRGATALAFDDGHGKPAKVSLAGASAALLYIDDHQGRVGTVTALVRVGGKPASSVPKAPVLPVVTQPPASSAPAIVLAAGVAKTFAGDLGCDADLKDYAPEAHRLDARTTLVLVPHPCENGAYNYMASAVLVRPGAKPVLARFDASPGMDQGDELLVNAGYDDKTRRLSTFAKGRGLGDCGVTEAFAWDGTQFRLVDQTAMGECRGSMDYIQTWRAEVRTGR
jgi:hypothetical protein